MVTYSTLHKRIRRQRGRARDHRCAHGDHPATDWAYDRSDPAEVMIPNSRGRLVPASLDPEHYIPLCRIHHHALDSGRPATLDEYPCGHPRTEENTYGGVRCRTCYNAGQNSAYHQRRMANRY